MSNLITNLSNSNFPYIWWIYKETLHAKWYSLNCVYIYIYKVSIIHDISFGYVEKPKKR